jgi:hypothetical protein
MTDTQLLQSNDEDEVSNPELKELWHRTGDTEQKLLLSLQSVCGICKIRGLHCVDYNGYRLSDATPCSLTGT